jgi:hypothetical protein
VVGAGDTGAGDVVKKEGNDVLMMGKSRCLNGKRGV